jgi:hypothetical protein
MSGHLDDERVGVHDDGAPPMDWGRESRLIERKIGAK